MKVVSERGFALGLSFPLSLATCLLLCPTAARSPASFMATLLAAAAATCAWKWEFSLLKLKPKLKLASFMPIRASLASFRARDYKRAK